VAERNRLQREIDGLLVQNRDLAEEVQELRASREVAVDRAEDTARQLAELDAEARALAGCVAAIEQMSSMRYSTLDTSHGFVPLGELVDSTTPLALTMPVGRILLHLAHRYGVPLTPTPAQDVHGA